MPVLSILKRCGGSRHRTATRFRHGTIWASRRNTARDYIEIGAALLLVSGLFLTLRRLEVLPDSVALPSSIGYTLAFIIGVVASISTCMAVTGGLLIAAGAKFNEANPALTAFEKFKPHLYFNAGRLISYTVLGGIIGAVGSALLLSQEANGVIILAVSLVMVVLGLQMLRLLPRVRLLPRRYIKTRLAKRLDEYAIQNAKVGAFLLGASTFFCHAALRRHFSSLYWYKVMH